MHCWLARAHSRSGSAHNPFEALPQHDRRSTPLRHPQAGGRIVSFSHDRQRHQRISLGLVRLLSATMSLTDRPKKERVGWIVVLQANDTLAGRGTTALCGLLPGLRVVLERAQKRQRI
jgi:hypothetical protein